MMMGSAHLLASHPLRLYWAVRTLDQRFPVQPNLDPIFLKLAHTIAELYPDRVRTAIENQYDTRILVFEFSHDSSTKQEDVLRVLVVAAAMQPKRLGNGEA